MQPRLTVRLTSFPESNGKRNWTALLVRVDAWGGLVGNCGGISLASGELWNRVAYGAERARFLIGERDTEPRILDYVDDIETPEQWAGETHGGRPSRKVEQAKPEQAVQPRDQIGADRLAAAVARLVSSRSVDARSEAADALLDYLDVGGVGGPSDVPAWLAQYEKRQAAAAPQKPKD